MKTTNFLLIAAFTLLTSFSFSQDASKVVDILKECACREIVVNARGVEKAYTATWLENIASEGDFIVFSKGENKHRWNAEKITFIEKGNGFIRIYMD